jgi:hypothetical protein
VLRLAVDHREPPLGFDYEHADPEDTRAAFDAFDSVE